MAKKKTNEEFIREVQDLVGTSYVFLQPYQGAFKKIAYYHVDCGEIHYINPNNFQNGQRCPSHKKIYADRHRKDKYTTSYFRSCVFNLVANEYTVRTKYVDAKTKVNIIHNKCGYKDWWVTPSDFLSGRRCPICSKKKAIKEETKSQAEFESEVKTLGKGHYKVLGKYKDWKTPVMLKHLDCGKEFPMEPTSFLRGSRCTCTRHYIGEDIIKDILDENRVSYKQHAKFDWLKYKRPQHLDFYLPKIHLAIEYDGEQHYRKTCVWYNKKVINRDKNKDNLCKLHHIRMIRIPYTYHNKESIKKFLIKARVIQS